MEKPKKGGRISSQKNKPKGISTVDIHYQKTPNYRTYYFDGVYGGMTINGKLYLDLFLERQPTPRRLKHEIDLNGEVGKFGKIVDGEGKSGIIREIEAGLILDITTAEKVCKFLEQKIKEHKKLLEQK